ncbi:MAG: ABC transporter permease/substrate-binding protein [Myxococcota bacterium]
MNAILSEMAALPELVAAHLQLTLLALFAGLAISLPLGILASRKPRLEAVSLAGASVLQTIPGLALLALMVPLLGALGLGLARLGLPAPPTIGFLPAVLALSLYSVLPMLRNTVTGIAGVSPALREAARGVGMKPSEVLLQVELPLALPTIVAGVRTATVWVVGMATLATPVGGTSLGNPIFAGLQTRNFPAVIAGSLAAAGLAVFLDLLVRRIELGLTQRSRRALIGPFLVLGLLFAGSFFPLLGAGRGGANGEAVSTIRIGSKTFTEQYILAELIGEVLREADPTLEIQNVPSLGSTVAFDALASGDLDLYVDYTGTLWATILKAKRAGESRGEILARVRESLARDHQVHLVAALGFENTYALAMRRADAEQKNLRRISDLVAHAGKLEILGDYEFFERPEWTALVSSYGFAFQGERAMDSSLMYEALKSGQGDVISAYSTDGRIEAYDLTVLEDDRAVIPPYDAVILVSARLRNESPVLVRRLEMLTDAIPAAAMRRMNAAVDLGGRGAREVALEWVDASSSARRSK